MNLSMLESSLFKLDSSVTMVNLHYVIHLYITYGNNATLQISDISHMHEMSVITDILMHFKQAHTAQQACER